jgi:hypothetical protein
MTIRLDYLGDVLPAGFERWVCSECTAACTFEAMNWCHGQMPCPYFREGVEANNLAYALIKRTNPMTWSAHPALLRDVFPEGEVPESLRRRPVFVELRNSSAIPRIKELAKLPGFKDSFWLVIPVGEFSQDVLTELRLLGLEAWDAGPDYATCSDPLLILTQQLERYRWWKDGGSPPSIPAATEAPSDADTMPPMTEAEAQRFLDRMNAR